MKPPPASPSRLTLKCLLLLACSALFLYEAAHADPLLTVPQPARAAELRHLLRQDCGACHGLTLQGGLGSPLTARALADKPADSLVATLLDGRPGSAMPPWRPFISEDEARWLIRQLQQGEAP
ncbi:c-type cytochrome [Vogesella sp. GCM10023246]|uniref:Cytochrome c n=1 Tax=Vogesella oryzagri TaxID=3160864 RepID=A0ABV1M2E6_9NEIS